MKLSSTNYDRLKFVSMIVLPALAVLVLGLGNLWEWPGTEKIVGTIVLLDTFLGVVLQRIMVNYNNSDASVDGFLTSTGTDDLTGHPDLQMTITTPPEELLSGKVARLRIGQPEPDHQ